MVNQIEGGFQTSADWPNWLRAAGGIAPCSTSNNDRPPAREAHTPPFITDAALGIYDVDPDGTPAALSLKMPRLMLEHPPERLPMVSGRF